MSKELFVKAEEVARELGISKPYAYKLVREMNEELKQKGFNHYSRTGEQTLLRRKNSTDCGTSSKEGTTMPAYKDKEKAHGMRPFTTRTGRAKRSRR